MKVEKNKLVKVLNPDIQLGVTDDAIEYIKSGVYPAVSISMWKARLTKAVFLLFAGYLGFHCYMASFWLPLVLCVLLMIFIISLKNKDLA